ncbi:hypothetical protein AURDEDRAFT_172819 [Auricularia subglabra TFB-10046 SS5]|nr:hypothetical protein AURDEDRAFT_172819 [Auricularia subglabra TFB-10046 SS5]
MPVARTMLRAANRGGVGIARSARGRATATRLASRQPRHNGRSGLARAMGSASCGRCMGLADDERGRALGYGGSGERDAACARDTFKRGKLLSHELDLSDTELAKINNPKRMPCLYHPALFVPDVPKAVDAMEDAN